MAAFIVSWESYFSELYSFISSLGGGRIDYANEACTEYILERLSVCIRSLSTIMERVQSADDYNVEEEEEEVIGFYATQLSQVSDCLQHIYRVADTF